MEAGRDPNLLKLDVRSVEMFRQKSLISDQEAPRARSHDGLIFETKTLRQLRRWANLTWLYNDEFDTGDIFTSEQQELLNLIEKQDANEVRGFFNRCPMSWPGAHNPAYVRCLDEFRRVRGPAGNAG